jgi:hypothetical protein
MAQTLEREWQTYEEQRARLLTDHRGEFVLIHEGEILGLFGSQPEAVNAGHQQLGDAPFLVQEVAEVETPSQGVTDAHSVEGAEAPQSAQELFAAIRDSGLIGMWKRRKDVSDSSAYARELRQRAQERRW